MQAGEQEVAAAVAGEDPAGPVAAVGGGREAVNENRRLVITPAGDRTSPVLLVPEGLAPDGGDLFPPGDQPRAGPADRLPCGQLGESARGAGELANLGRVAGGRRQRGRGITGPAGSRRHWSSSHGASISAGFTAGRPGQH